MKTIIQKLWMVMAILCLSIPVSAYDFEVAGLQYEIVDITSLTAKIVGCNEQLEGALSIPTTVKLSNRELAVVEIEKEAFKGNGRITSLQIGDNVTDIGRRAFEDCNRIAEISFGSSLKTIENEAFQGCTSIKSLSLESPIESIGAYAFNSCPFLNSVNIPNTLKRIGNGAFGKCSSLSKVNISDLKSWCQINFDSFVFDNMNLSLYIQDSLISIINIPDGISEIKSYAFNNFKNIKGVSFPKSVKKIGEYAFHYCDISSFSLPENLDSIMANAFNGTPITELNIPKSVRFITDLGKLPKIKKISFEDGENPIEIKFSVFRDAISSSFVDGSDIEELYLGRQITMNCESGHWVGSSLVISSFYECLKRSAFFGLKSLTKVVIGANCNQITPRWFYGCSNLTHLVIQDSLNPIDFHQNIYYDKERPNSFPKYSTEVKYVETFVDCPLEYVYIGRNINYTQMYDGIIAYPNTRLSPFENKKTINTVVIGNEVQSLPASNFFKDDNIQSIEIGHSLSYIPSGSFEGNNEIKSIAIRAEVPPEYLTPFKNFVYINAVLYVPITSVSIYQDSEPWKNFWNIWDIENYTSGIPTIYNNKKDRSVSVSYDGLIYKGASKCHMAIYSIDGKLYYSEDVEPNKYIYLPKGIYIVKLNDDAVKIKI